MPLAHQPYRKPAERAPCGGACTHHSTHSQSQRAVAFGGRKLFVSGNFCGPTAEPLGWVSGTASSVFSRTRQPARQRIWRGEGARTPHARPEVMPALAVAPCRTGPALNVTEHFSAVPETGRARVPVGKSPVTGIKCLKGLTRTFFGQSSADKG